MRIFKNLGTSVKLTLFEAPVFLADEEGEHYLNKFIYLLSGSDSVFDRGDEKTSSEQKTEEEEEVLPQILPEEEEEQSPTSILKRLQEEDHNIKGYVILGFFDIALILPALLKLAIVSLKVSLGENAENNSVFLGFKLFHSFIQSVLRIICFPVALILTFMFETKDMCPKWLQEGEKNYYSRITPGHALAGHAQTTTHTFIENMSSDSESEGDDIEGDVIEMKASVIYEEEQGTDTEYSASV